MPSSSRQRLACTSGGRGTWPSERLPPAYKLCGEVPPPPPTHQPHPSRPPPHLHVYLFTLLSNAIQTHPANTAAVLPSPIPALQPSNECGTTWLSNG